MMIKIILLIEKVSLTNNNVIVSCGKTVDMVDNIEIFLKTNFIKLDQLLKLINLVAIGSEAKLVIEEGKVFVNEEIEIRRGRKIYPGDQVRYKDTKVIIKKNESKIKEN
jgi:ribosome-associated protein